MSTDNRRSFRGAKINHVVIQAGEGGVFLRLNIRADYTPAVREQMNWPELSARSKGMEIEDELSGGRLRISSQQQQLDGTCPEMQISIQSAGAFKVVRVMEKDEEATREELRFQVRTIDENAAALCFDFKSRTGKALSDLVITEDAEAGETMPSAADERQDELPLDNALNAEVSKKKRKQRTRAEMTFEGGVDGSPTEEERARMDQIIDSNFAEVGEETAQEI